MVVHHPDGPSIVQSYLDRERISQEELAKRANVSQSTVSRALARDPARRTRAHARLFAFIHEQTGAPPLLPSTVASAFARVWDGTERHEEALAALVDASVELWPKMKEGG